VGRAGRAVARATVILLPGHEDRAVWEYFASLTFPPERTVRQVLAALRNSGGATSTAVLETHVDLRRARLEMMLKVLDVEGAVRRVGGGWTASGTEWRYDAERYDRVAEARRSEQDAMLEYSGSPACRMEFLRNALDDPGAAPCGRCDNCGGVVLPGTVDPHTLASAADRLQRPGIVVEPRLMWPGAMSNLGIDLKGRIPQDEQAGEGRAIARLTDLGWGGPLRELLRPDAADGELPVPLRRALAAVLDAWEFAAPCDSIAFVGSVGRPLLVGHLADGLSRYTGWPVVAEMHPRSDRSPATASVNSAQRLRAVHDRLVLETRQSPSGRRVLLVDDVTDSGWTLTVTARMLRRSGAAAVHPLVLAVASG
jgi:ATP-dependent DNA helicase RecQ